jgi:arylsulfatase A-like enzyme
MPDTLPKGKERHGLIANFDFYSTIATLAGRPIPERCDGVDPFPYLTGKQTGDAHEYLFWLNNEPGDAVRRHMISVRWQDWRLYRKYEKDSSQLFDLKQDPREERDLASKHPNIVKQLAAKHAAWSKTLAPLGKISDLPAVAPIIPSGHGWDYAQKD